MATSNSDEASAETFKLLQMRCDEFQFKAKSLLASFLQLNLTNCLHSDTIGGSLESVDFYEFVAKQTAKTKSFPIPNPNLNKAKLKCRNLWNIDLFLSWHIDNFASEKTPVHSTVSQSVVGIQCKPYFPEWPNKNYGNCGNWIFLMKSVDQLNFFFLFSCIWYCGCADFLSDFSMNNFY